MLFVLISSALAFGTTENWSYAIMESLCLIALLLFFIKIASRKEQDFYNVPGLIPLLCFLAYMLFQIIPLPAAIIELISPARYQIQKETVNVFEQSNWFSLTINKKATLMEFFRITAYMAFYVITVQLMTKKEYLRKTVIAVIVFASLLSFFSLIQYFLSNNKIYWLREVPALARPFGPYVNRNHYVGLMGMLFPVILSMFLYYKPTVRYGSLREKIVGVFDHDKTNLHLILGFLTVLISTSIFLSLSRGGIISLFISMIFFMFMILSKDSSRKKGIIVILVCILVLLSVGWFGWEPILERFWSMKNVRGDITDMRIDVWKNCLNIIKDFPLTGTGIGSFLDSYPGYRTVLLDHIYTYDHAHNDYIELLTDGGIIAFLLAVWFIGAVFYHSYKTLKLRKQMYSVYLFIGSTIGMIYMLIYSITDFNLHIGANGLFFFFLAGLVVSSANTRMNDDHKKTYLIKKEIPAKQLGIFTGVVLFACLVFNSGILIGAGYFSSVNNLNSAGELNPVKDRVSIASLFDPFEPKYPYVIANMELRRSDMEQAAVHAGRAVKLIPVNGGYLQQLGLIYSELQDHEIADKLLKSGIRYDISDPLRYRVYASWLLSRGEREKGIGYIKTGISMEPNKTRTYIALMALRKLSDDEIRSSLPELAEPYILFADYLEKTGNKKMAVEVKAKIEKLKTTNK